MDHRGLATALSSSVLEKDWGERGAEAPDASPEQVADARQFVARLHEQVLLTLQDANDSDEREQLALMHYIHLKSQWTLLQKHIGYLMEAGRINNNLILRAAFLTPLMTALEAHLPAYVAAHIRRFLSNPEGEPLEIPDDERPDMSLDTEEIKPETEPMFPRARGKGSKTKKGDEAETIRDLQAQLRRLKGSATDTTLRLAALQAEHDLLTTRLHEAEAAAAAPPLPEETELMRQIHALHDAMDTVRTEADQLRKDWDILTQETGRETAADVIAHIRNLNDMMTTDTVRYRKMQDSQELLKHEFGDITAKEIIIRFRTLHADLASKDRQYAPLVENKATLERELGQGDAAEILRIIRNMRDKTFSLERQIANLNAERDALFRETGCRDNQQLIGQIRRFNDSIVLLKDKLTPLQTDRSLFESEIGSADAREIVRCFRQLQEEVAALQKGVRVVERGQNGFAGSLHPPIPAMQKKV